jgi:hypothetical protein
MLPKSGGAFSNESAAMLLQSHAVDSVRKREFDLGIVELFDVRANSLTSFQRIYFNNRNAAKSGPVARCHFSVHLLNRSNSFCITILLVHVVNSTTAIIAEENAEILDLEGLRLENFIHSKNFTLALLNLLQFAEIIPKSTFGYYFVWRKNPHAVDFGVLIGLGGQMTTNDLIFTHRLNEGLVSAATACSKKKGKVVP